MMNDAKRLTLMKDVQEYTFSTSSQEMNELWSGFSSKYFRAQISEKSIYYILQSHGFIQNNKSFLRKIF